MIAYIFSILPVILASFCAVIVTWLLCKFWYSANYVHTREVQPLQESQYVMQNQYAILAERIKHADQKVLQLTEKLEHETLAHQEAIAKIATLENQLSILPERIKDASTEMELQRELITLLESQQLKNIGSDEVEKNKMKELINVLRQSIQEFKVDFSQKILNSSSRQSELSAQLWQLLETNKKLSEETATLSKAMTNFLLLNEKSQERQFTLAALQKRS